MVAARIKAGRPFRSLIAVIHLIVAWSRVVAVEIISNQILDIF